MKKHSVRNMVIGALLIAMGIVIPMVMPVKVIIGPASFTLASHVPVLIAMFFSPLMAIAVAVGTAVGFFISTTPIIALRALSHIVFAIIGARYLNKHPKIVLKNGEFTLLNMKFQLFNLVIGLIHTAAEVAVVSIFFFMGNMPETMYTAGYFYSILLLMGVGGIIHSLVDYNIAYFIAGALYKHFDIPVFAKAKAIERAEKLKTIEAA